jgi:predicted choloylglycine hydrolase
VINSSVEQVVEALQTASALRPDRLDAPTDAGDGEREPAGVTVQEIGYARAPPEFHTVAAATNHQGRVEWPEYARAIRSVEREQRVLELLRNRTMTRERFVAAFLEPPLRSTEYAQGFGTTYTAAYYPAEGRAEYRWPGFTWQQSLDGFEESSHLRTFSRDTESREVH